MARELTARERNVLEYVDCGDTAKQIAIRPDIVPRTVEKHIDQARLKLRAKNRAHLVTQALQTGIISDDDEKPGEQEVAPFTGRA